MTLVELCLQSMLVYFHQLPLLNRLPLHLADALLVALRKKYQNRIHNEASLLRLVHSLELSIEQLHLSFTPASTLSSAFLFNHITRLVLFQVDFSKCPIPLKRKRCALHLAASPDEALLKRVAMKWSLQMRHLTIENCPSFTDSHISALSSQKWTALESLTVKRTAVKHKLPRPLFASACLQSITTTHKLPKRKGKTYQNVRQLNLSQCQIEWKNFNWPSLLSLTLEDIAWQDQVEEKILKMVESMPKLGYLSIVQPLEVDPVLVWKSLTTSSLTQRLVSVRFHDAPTLSDADIVPIEWKKLTHLSLIGTAVTVSSIVPSLEDLPCFESLVLEPPSEDKETLIYTVLDQDTMIKEIKRKDWIQYHVRCEKLSSA